MNFYNVFPERTYVKIMGIYINMFLNLKKLCSPSLLYLAISLILFFLWVFSYQGKLSWLLANSAITLLFIAFWTWVLDLICKAGYKTVSWILVLIPIILFVLSFFIDLMALVYGRSSFVSSSSSIRL